jgi:hypothetical protein
MGFEVCRYGRGRTYPRPREPTKKQTEGLGVEQMVVDEEADSVMADVGGPILVVEDGKANEGGSEAVAEVRLNGEEEI